MVRVNPTHGNARGSSVLDRSRAAPRKKKPYKVVLEMVTQEKKKFHHIMAYSANAPLGYTFVPLGDRELTEYCKDQCRKRNLVAHTVSARPKPPKSKVQPDGDRNSNHLRIDTQRIGHHFPDEVVDKACQFLGYEWNRRGGFRKIRTDYETTELARSLHDYGERMLLHGQPATEKQTEDQVRSAILEVFPKVPEADLESIVTHSFKEGTNRVGNATDLTLARRVQLAVGAFIRHQYTNYDQDLKEGGWTYAREKSRPVSYAKLKEWRGEGDDAELEEIFREVIVLDDDDEDSDVSDVTSSTLDEREASLEIISSRATVRELGPETYPDVVHGYERTPSANVRAPAPARSSGTNESYMGPTQTAVAHYRGAYETTSRPVSTMRSTYEPDRAMRPAPPRYVRDKDGRLYNVSLQHDSGDHSNTFPFGSRGQHLQLQPIDTPEPHSSTARRDESSNIAPLHNRDGYVYTPSRLSSVDKGQVDKPTLSRRSSGDHVVLPSIERESGVHSSPRRMLEPSWNRYEQQDYDRIPMSRHEAQLSSETVLRLDLVLPDRRPLLLPNGGAHYMPSYPVRYTDERARQVYAAPPLSREAHISPLYSRAPPVYAYPPPPPHYRTIERPAVPSYGYVEPGGPEPRDDVAADGRDTRSGRQHDSRAWH